MLCRFAFEHRKSRPPSRSDEFVGRGLPVPMSHLGDSTETSPVSATSSSYNPYQHSSSEELLVVEEGRREYFYPEIYPETWLGSPRSSHGRDHCKPLRTGAGGDCLSTSISALVVFSRAQLGCDSKKCPLTSPAAASYPQGSRRQSPRAPETASSSLKNPKKSPLSGGADFRDHMVCTASSFGSKGQ